MGGRSSEREVSLESGKAVFDALVKSGYNVVSIDADEDLYIKLKEEKIEVAFIALHGKYGEDGCVQGLLEMMGIPYTGSGVLASSLCMNKLFSKLALSAKGLSVAPYKHYKLGESVDLKNIPFDLPFVVKPVKQGSSVGVSLVKEISKLKEAVDFAFKYDDEILIEKFIKAKEIQVGILDNKSIGAIEIVPKNEFYDFEAKYTDGMAEHFFPARVDKNQYDKILEIGELSHKALGCDSYSRVDLLVTDDNYYILEINTLPGMTKLSLLPEIAQKGAFISFEELACKILESATLKG